VCACMHYHECVTGIFIACSVEQEKGKKLRNLKEYMNGRLRHSRRERA
jgi:hypothetical protein